jgi:hypothetical protein
MALPYLLGLGGENVFIKDFYAKRIMSLFGLPFFGLILFLFFMGRQTGINKNIFLYILLYFLIFLYSILQGNSASLIVTDAFIAMLPVIFYLCVNKTGFNIDRFLGGFNYLLIIAAALVILGVKLQFSYFSLISVVYLIFLLRWNKSEILLLLALPILLVESLIGKSALLMLFFLIAYFFILDKNLVSFQKKVYLLLIPSLAFILLLIIFWEQIQTTGSYRNFVYFLNNTDFSSLSFKDASTGHRLFEAQRVLEEFENADFFKRLLGHGFGATIDLSNTPDVTVANANENLSAVRHIHIGIFAVMFRYGIVGLIIYVLFIFKMAISSFRVLRRTHNKALALSSLYLLILLFDSLISFPHMMSNFLFWLLTFVVLAKEKELYTKSILINS